MDGGLIRGDDGRRRCWWPGHRPDYVAYHDAEWGLPVADDRRLFEKLCLEGFQAGLSWYTILKRREAFRRAFAGFAIEAVAAMGEADVARLLQDPGIIRHRGKIEAAIANARVARDLRGRHGSLAAYVWAFEPAPAQRPPRLTGEAVRALVETPASRALAQDLRRRGWRFLGPVSAYAFMQSVGLVNDHVEGCHRREPCEEARLAFVRP